MKTSELKKSFTQFQTNHQSKAIKLKFQNIKTEEDPQAFTVKDSSNIQLVFKYLETIINQKQSSNHDMQKLNYELMKKLKKMIENNQQENNDNGKIKFRIVKSAKKQSAVYNSSIKKNQSQSENQFVKLNVGNNPFLSALSQNRSQIIQNKQNMSGIVQKQITMSQSMSSNFNSKLKLKKISQYKKLQVLDTNQRKIASNDDHQKKLREQLKRISDDYAVKVKENQKLNQKLNNLTKQNQSAKSKLVQMQNNEKLNLQIKFSLKCLEAEALQTPKKVQNQISNQNTIVPEQMIKQHEKNYYEDLCKHLQLIIVSQNKEIQILHKKISDNSEKVVNNAKKTPERWNNY